MTPEDERHLRRAVALAVEAREAGDQPYGALLVGAGGEVLAEDRNTVAGDRDLTAHPELKLARWAGRELDPAAARATTLYTSCQPCGMCAQAIAYAGLGRVVYALATAEHDALVGPASTPPPVVWDGPADLPEARRAVEGFRPG